MNPPSTAELRFSVGALTISKAGLDAGALKVVSRSECIQPWEAASFFYKRKHAPHIVSCLLLSHLASVSQMCKT